MNPTRSESYHWPTWAVSPMLLLIRRALRKRFCGIWISRKQLAHDPEATTRPLLCCASHTNWWDGFLAAIIHHDCLHQRRFTLMQEQQHLDKYPFFKWAGAFGLDLDGSVLPGMREALRRLQNPSCALWMFPQGKFYPPQSPASVLPGAALLARRSGANLLPMWFRFEWLYESKPAIFIDVGPLLDSAQADQLEHRMEDLRATNLNRRDHENYLPLLQPAPSLNKVWEVWGRRFGLLKKSENFDQWNR